MPERLIFDQWMQELKDREARLRSLWEMTPGAARRGYAPWRAEPRAVRGLGGALPRAGASAQRRVRVPRRPHAGGP